jgi:hypothetical protein
MAVPPRLRCLGAALIGCGALLAATPAFAHGFGQRFDLPLPIQFWVAGAGATIVLTFVVVAIFVRERGVSALYPRLNLFATPALAWLGHPILLEIVRALGVIVFLVTLLAGFFGVQDPYRNIIVTMIWITWWVGFAFVCALLGNLWALVNPWSTIFEWAERAFAALTGGRRLSLDLRYPERLGVWPAVILFLLFAWSELVWSSSDIPAALARAALLYSLLAWLGMLLFGRELWLERGEAFSIAFGVLARFALFESHLDPESGRRALNLRPPGAGLLERMVSWSFLVFVLLMLATVTFDGLLETPLWQRLMNGLYANPDLARLFFNLADYGISDTEFTQTTALVVIPLSFILIFVLVSWLMVRAAGSDSADETGRRPTTGTVARAFVLTLVPIAVAYHLSHYFSFLLTSGQFVIPLLSDPFGFGWNLFGTAGYRVNYAIVSPYFFWYAALTLIVIGHVVAVYLAHLVALRVFGARRAALTSQIPMVLLMVGYTMLSLWIMAQPIMG